MKCGRETEVFSRVTGYHRPIKNWNRGKQEEFKERANYDLNQALTRSIKAKSDAGLAVIILMALFILGICAGCVSKSTTETTTTKYVNGQISEVVVVKKEERAGPLAKKAVSIEQDARAVKIETAVDPETGTVLPKLEYFGGNSAIDTMPMIDTDKLSGTNYSESLTIESSYWDDSVAFFKHRRKGAGNKIPDSPLKYNMNVNVGADTNRTNFFQSLFK